MENQKPLILIIDDVPENIQVLLQILENQEFRFAVATGAVDAFKAVEAEKPALILLDIIIPNVNGYEICRKLKDNPETENIPVIFLTVLDEMEDVLKGFSLGAVDYITKPFNEHEVLARVNTQLKLQQANSKLKELNQTKDKLFSIIAHEIKNPFSNIINFSELILENLDSYNQEKLRSILKSIHVDALKSFELLENLLLWSRSQLKNDFKINMQPVVLKEIVDSVVSFNKEAVSNKKLSLVNKVDPNAMIFSDINMAETIVRNLVSNAIKFTQEGEIRLSTIEVEDHIELIIQDTGIGIGLENLEKIFDLTYFTTRGTSSEKGSGLGLIITREFVEQNQGKISVKSKRGEGSTFTVSFLKVK